MGTKDILLIILPVITAFCTYFFTLKTKKNEAMLKFKEEKYTNLLILLQAFVGNTASTHMKRKFFQEQYQSWLYSSDGVVKAINEMIELVKCYEGEVPDVKKGRIAIGNIVLEMRKDMLGKTNLNSSDFIYTNVVD